MSLRLLGECPECGIEDKLVELPYKEDLSHLWKVRCEDCNIIYDDRIKLMYEENRKGNKLISVSIERWEDFGVELSFPEKDEVPYSDLIIAMLNSALMTKFNLNVDFITEGGLEGMDFELRNIMDKIGLYVDEGEESAKEALDFYEKMLRQLFEEPLSFGNVTFRRGEILWLDETENSYSDALIYLFGTLTRTTDRAFAERILKTKEQVEKTPLGPYLRGLSDEEIEKFFIPPPI